jgi:hypothetical protein
MSGIDPKRGEAVLRDPAILSRNQDVNALYQGFEDTAGLQSPKLARELAGQMESPAQANRTIEAAKQALAPYIDYNASRASGTIVYDKAKVLADVAGGKLQPRAISQSLYEASQGAAYLKRLGRAGSPAEIANQAGIGEFKSNADDLLELINPTAGYGAARTAAFEQRAREQFSTAFPLNANGSPNQLRGYTGLATAAAAIPTALMTGSPLPLIGLAAPVVSSPMVYGGAIRAGAAFTRVLPAAARVTASPLAEAYMNRRRIPEPDPAFQAIGGMRPAYP